MRHLAEQVEAAAGLAGHGFAEDAGRQVGGVEAVAGVGLGVEHIGLVGQAADLRQAIGADADHAAPLVVDAHIRQLRKHGQHLGPHIGRNIRRITPGVMAGATEQQAPVGGEAVVIQRHPLVTQGHILRNQFGRQLRRQRFGGDQVAAGSNDLAAEATFEPTVIGIAAQHQLPGAHPPASGMYGDGRTMVDGGRSGVLIQAHPQGAGCSGFAQGQVERVEMAGAHVDQPADIAVRAHHAAHLVRLDKGQCVPVTQCQQFVAVGAEGIQMPRLVRQIAVAPGKIAVDVELGDPLADDLHGFDAQHLQIPDALRTDHPGKLLEIMADTTDQLPTVAPAGAPANLSRFQQHHRQSPFGQFDGGIEAGETSAHDADIRLLFALQRGQPKVGMAGGGIPGGWIIGGMDGVA